MAFSTDQLQNTGSFLPTTQMLDISMLYSVDVKSPEFKELLARLYQYINLISLVVNTKETGYYINQEINTSKLFFNPLSNNQTQLRPIFRTVVDVGTLAAGVTLVNHNIPITNTYSFTTIYGAASDSLGNNYYPLPFASAGGAANIELFANATQVSITNNSGVAFDNCYVVLEYIKS